MTQLLEYYVRLEDITTKIGSGATPLGGKEAYFTSGISLIRSLNIYDNEFSYDSLAFIDHEQAAKLRNVIVEEDDILLNITGASVCRCCIVPASILPARVNQHVAIIRIDKTKADPRYILYTINSPTFKQALFNISMTGATREALTKSDICNFKVPLPELRTQQKIASILTAYDDLIENNKRRIAILEKMAEEIYREWFVRMRFSSYAKATEDKPANQSKRVKGCPPGWTVSKLSDVLELCYGKALKEEDRIDGPYPVYGSSGVVGHHNRALVNESGIIVGRKGNVGSIHWSDEPFYPIDTVYFVRSELPKEYLYFLLHGMNFINNDAAVPGLSRSQAYANQFFLPPSESISRFAELMRPFFQLKKIISGQVSLLVRTRDLLLPRLISGKLSVDKLELPSNEKLASVSSTLPQQELAHA